MRAAAANLDAQKNAGSHAATASVKSTPPPASSSQIKPAPTVKSTTPPASYPGVTPAPAPAMTSKQARLADLLNKYKMDQITPQEYFDQKAKILAEP